MPDAPTLPPSTTHRFCFFGKAPDKQKHKVVEHCIADEIEELREFVKFLYPPRGQDRFKLCRPDILEPRWTVTSKLDAGATVSFSLGATPLEAVRNAISRQKMEDAGNNIELK